MKKKAMMRGLGLPLNERHLYSKDQLLGMLERQEQEREAKKTSQLLAGFLICFVLMPLIVYWNHF